MEKAQAIDSILEAAIKVFAAWGFEGASLRVIAAEAGVSLSAINAYYGSKKQLFIAAELVVWDEIAADRDASLKQALERNPGRPAALRDVLEAMVLPIVRRARSNSESVRNRLYFIRGRIREHATIGGAKILLTVNRSVVRWIDILGDACPTLSRPDVIWLFSYCLGVIYSMQVMDGRYDSLLGKDAERSAEDITRDIVEFCTAGAQAIVALRGSESPKP